MKFEGRQASPASHLQNDRRIPIGRIPSSVALELVLPHQSNRLVSLSDESEISESKKVDIVIIGGGAAGFFAAIHAAETDPEATVVVLEKSPRVLTKVLVSGGGRCNVTHACFDPRELTRRYPRGERELLGPFHGWQPQDTIDWFQSRGVELKTETDGRMFPTTDRSETIADCLLDSAKKACVRILTKRAVTDFQSRGGEGFEIDTDNNGTWIATKLMIATGGLKAGPVLDRLRAAGHSIQPLAPSLFTFHIDDARIKGLQGLSVDHVETSIRDSKLNEAGPMLITHWGLSGPAILKLSAWGARELHGRNYRFGCVVNWTGSTNTDTALQDLRQRKQSDGRKRIGSSPQFALPRRIWERLVAAAQISETQTWSQANAEALKRLAEQLTACEFQVTGKSMNKEEFVTCGGVTLKEVNFKTMESRQVPGLFFGGEVLDIDAITGGFNFQAAWTTGRLAGLAMAQS